MKTIHQSTLTHLQEVYFDVCDTLNGESAKDLGYKSKAEMFEEFKWKLEAIEKISGLSSGIWKQTNNRKQNHEQQSNQHKQGQTLHSGFRGGQSLPQIHQSKSGSNRQGRGGGTFCCPIHRNLGPIEREDTMNLITLDKEISVGDKVYYALVQADVEFHDSEDPEPCGVEINNAEISLDGDLLPLAYEGRRDRKSHRHGASRANRGYRSRLYGRRSNRYNEDNATKSGSGSSGRLR
jgi:hypothetical protein